MKKNITLFLVIFSILISCNKDSDDTNNTSVPSFDFSLSKPPTTEIPYSEISQKEYTIELDRWDIPNNRKEAIKTTNNLQKAINWANSEGFGIIKLPKGHYLIGKYGNDIYQAGIELKSNMAFLLNKEAVIEMAPNDKWNYCAIAIRNKTKVIVSGGTIIGDRENHNYVPRKKDGSITHDEGHLICIEGKSQDIIVSNIHLTKANGDGILFVSSKGDKPSLKDSKVMNNNISENRRQGISIVGGINITIENNEIHHTKGTSPQFGIDIESLGRVSKDIIIKSNSFHHNKGGDIVNTDGKNILVEGNTMHQGEGSRYIDGPIVYWKNADWTVKNNNITMITTSVNNWNGIIMYSNNNLKTNPAITYIENNICNNCGFYMYKGADLVVRNNYFNNGHLVFWKMKNLILENNRVTHPQKCWAYRFLEVNGKASRNTYNGTPFPIPLKENEPWDGCWIN